MVDISQYSLLSKIDSPIDLKRLSPDELEELTGEMRHFLIDVVSRTGGHLGSNLGVVELTIALHYVYNAPKDLIVWDVGAQAYSHKILTGRMKQFDTNRQYGGISGFPHREESEYDAFTVGHSSTSISAALGMAVARDQKDEKHRVLAVIGDGGMTGGMAYEGLNNAGVSGTDLTVILNDNRMAISPSVGALSQYLASIRSHLHFEKLKDGMWQLTERLPKSGKFQKALRGMDVGLRSMLVPGLWFERLGFRYVGPIDGHNLTELIKMFRWLKTASGPIVVHILTKKGKGYKPAEEADTNFHGVSKFNPVTGPVKDKNGQKTFAGHFSGELLKLAKKDERIIAITPAMLEGSELEEFQETLPDRCFDVGITEQHAVTFAAGLATQGLIPVVAIYSTFLQRAFDQIVHDVALPNLHVVFGVDRAGLVGEDGPTHHGAFDLSYLRHIPNLTILIPRDQHQLILMLNAAIKEINGPVAIRFPRGKPPEFSITSGVKNLGSYDSTTNVRQAELLRKGKDGLIIGSGILLAECISAADELAENKGLNLAVLDIKCVKPLDAETLMVMAARFSLWLTVEENVLMGGMGASLLEFISDQNLKVNVKRMGLPDSFVTHGDRESLLKEVGLDANSIKQSARLFFRKTSRLSRKKSKAEELEV
ncbi:MAG: 1-deoxy-D-xylulose-5-phosphate synthase [Candidatus Hatepunaea meridiana]|nr:1-deoxy-D-xylulose-5-phosphate synthase [Candidatus Hatepunaea meridiana]